MRRKLNGKILAAVIAAVMLLALLPASALADDAPNLSMIASASEAIPDESSGSYFVTPSAYAGGTITLYIGVENKGTADASGVTCTLPGDVDLEKYPFRYDGATPPDLTAASDVKFVPSTTTDAEGKTSTTWTKVSWDSTSEPLKPGERGYFKLTATYSDAVSTIDKQLSFTVTYTGAANPLTCTKTVKVATQSSGNSSSGSSYKSTPKVIIDGYRFNSERVYAGEDVTLQVTIRNTSTTEAVKNMTIDFSDTTGDITPAAGGSNSIFVGQIEKSSSITLSILLSVSPGAEAKSHLLDFELVYEGTRNRAEFTEKSSITVPVLQKIRVRVAAPAIYGDPWVGQSVSMSLSLYNLGKSTIYNCSVEVEGDGLSLEEAYFGGNIAAGGTMRADLSVISDVAGDVTGRFKITFEDMYGDTYEEYVDFTMFVNDMEDFTAVASPGDAVPEEDMSAAGGFAWYWWLLIAVVVIAGAVVLIVVLRKRRRKYLEEL